MLADEHPRDSVFGSIEQASEFFRRGSVGFSPSFRRTDCQSVRRGSRSTPAAASSRGAFARLLQAAGLLSATDRRAEFEGMELRSIDWQVHPLAVRGVESSWFADRRRFPAGSVEFDSALLMRNIRHEWRACDLGGECAEGAVIA